jgi:hypothetical protein
VDGLSVAAGSASTTSADGEVLSGEALAESVEGCVVRDLIATPGWAVCQDDARESACVRVALASDENGNLPLVCIDDATRALRTPFDLEDLRDFRDVIFFAQAALKDALTPDVEFFEVWDQPNFRAPRVTE